MGIRDQSHLPLEHRTSIESTKDVQKTSWASSEHLKTSYKACTFEVQDVNSLLLNVSLYSSLS